MSAKESVSSSEVSYVPLIFDMFGPFVVHFCKGTAHIHAPLCAEHFANLLTDKSDIPLTGLPATATGKTKGFVYHFKDGTAPEAGQGHKCHQPKQLLLVACTTPPIPTGKSHLMFELPYPDEIVPLRSEQVFIHQGNATTWLAPGNQTSEHIVDDSRARGLRFIYWKCSQEPIVELSAGESDPPAPQDVPNFKGFSCRTLGFKPPHFSMTLRFSANHATADDRHQDAYSCFETMRNMFSDVKAWRADFNDSVTCEKGKVCILNLSGSHPKDCGAAIMIVQDDKNAPFRAES